MCAPRGRGRLYEMRPVRSTPAHQTGDFAELVCSNSLKSDTENTAPWLLKEEMRRAGSCCSRLPGSARFPLDMRWPWIAHFAAQSHRLISREPLIPVRREEVPLTGSKSPSSRPGR